MLYAAELSEAPGGDREVSEGDFVAPTSGVNPSPAPSFRQSEGKLTPSSSYSSLRGSKQSPAKRGPWTAFMSGAKKLIDAMADIVDSDDETGSQKAFHSRHASSVSGMSDIDLADPLYQLDKGHTVEALGSSVVAQPFMASAVEIPEITTSDESQLVRISDMQAIASHVPLRHRQKRWTLLYSTHRDGISMQTLLRKCKDWAPTVLIVRDMEKHVFGAYCSESWKLSSRYYGTGETFVFKIDPEPGVWHWWWKKSHEIQNDFFMWGAHDAIAVGGAGGYALWLDAELHNGISRSSLTFGNSSLASTEEFLIGSVEVWGFS